MSRKNSKEKKKKEHRLHPETKRSIWAIALTGAAVILALAGLGYAGPLGRTIYRALDTLLGIGYVLLPVVLLFAAGVLFTSHKRKVLATTIFGALLVLLSALGMIDIIAGNQGGWLGFILGSLKHPFGAVAGLIVNALVFVIGILVTANVPLKLRLPERKEKEEFVVTGDADEESELEEEEETDILEPEEEFEEDPEPPAEPEDKKASLFKGTIATPTGKYIPPPLSLLETGSERPTTGDLRANANIIKRTLESFGIPVEMGEVNVGPKVTRYTLKPSEGTKLSKIEALHKDLALALAAHPIRIEAPIPGKSLVGIEVPNKAAALVRLGNLMKYKEFKEAGFLGVILGRDVSGEPVLADIEKMPHLLIAGSTGSGKSVTIHSLLISLLYKNAPSTLRLILIDPKRVELPIYEGIPHLVSPVITDNKKAVGVFRWAIEEMDRRYDILSDAGARDIGSYNKSHSKEPLPFLLIVVDELADLMTSYGREVEGSIVRLAQMARATGIHLVLSTQRPSVEIITGLIKANITSRIALQVASQIDSRTILDTSGAEKLLGGGDLLFISSQLSKPKRIQCPYISETEVKRVSEFIRTKNRSLVSEEETPDFEEGKGTMNVPDTFDDYMEDEEDELYSEAVRVVVEARKASASLLQRRLKVGYARAARLLDLMEERGIVGPGEGAKPREVYVDEVSNY